MFGLTVPVMPPSLAARAIIRVIVSLPEARALPLSGCAEMAGCVIFRMLRDRGVALFADEPAVAERIWLLYDEILADEIGHVGFIAALLPAGQRRLMRTLYRVFGPLMAGALPELVALVGRDEIRRRFAAPFTLEAMAAELPGLAYAAAPV